MHHDTEHNIVGKRFGVVDGDDCDIVTETAQMRDKTPVSALVKQEPHVEAGVGRAARGTRGRFVRMTLRA